MSLPASGGGKTSCFRCFSLLKFCLISRRLPPPAPIIRMGTVVAAAGAAARAGPATKFPAAAVVIDGETAARAEIRTETAAARIAAPVIKNIIIVIESAAQAAE